MKWLFRRKNRPFIQKITTPSLFVIAIITGMLIAPKKNVFKYDYSKGQPWKYEDLISDFNFPIYKTKEQVKLEKDSIKQNHLSYFYISQKQAKNAQQRFNKDLLKVFQLKRHSSQDSVQILRIAEKLRHEIKLVYEKGILSPRNMSGSNQIFFLIEENVAHTAYPNEFQSEKQAFLRLHKKMDSLSNKYKTNLPNLPIEHYIEPNILYDKGKTDKSLKEELNTISPVKGLVRNMEIIISKGEPVDDRKYAILESLKKEFEQPLQDSSPTINTNFGQLILSVLTFISLYLYFYLYDPESLKNVKHTLYLLILPLFFLALTRIFIDFDITTLLIPYAILPVVTTNFYNAQTATFHHTIMILFVSFFVKEPLEFIYSQFIIGFFAAVSISRLTSRKQILKTVGLIILISVITFTSFSLLREGNFYRIRFEEIAQILVSGVFVLISFPIIYLFEKLFSYLSEMTLLEMSDLNHPLLKELSEKAPGTLQHSLQVANLSESVAVKIGANPLLTRVGALFHDIGKMEKPQFYTENQISNINPHDNMLPAESAKIIKSHVTAGIELSKKHNLPKEIQEFIESHHGNRNITWFLHAEKQLKKEEDIDFKAFTYSGPKPKSKEAAIVMCTDSVEASAKCLQSVNAQSIHQLLDQIINNLIDNKQLENADITFLEVAQMKKILEEKLLSIYHIRIPYPKEEV